MLDKWLDWSLDNKNWKGHFLGPQTVLPLLFVFVAATVWSLSSK